MTQGRTANRIKQGLWILALALTAPIAQAAPAWQINPSGLGVSGATAVSEVTVGGVGFVQRQPTSETDFTFTEHGAYRLALPGAQEITVVYSVAGNGLFANPFALHFNTGSINLYADPNFDFASATGTYGADNGTPLASFSIFAGGIASNGMVNLSARLDAGTLRSGYLFDAAGNDLANADNVLMQLGVFNQTTTPDALLLSEIVCGLAGYGGAGCNGSPYVASPFAFTVQDGGQMSLASVPEPATSVLLLAGLGVIPLAARRRRRRAE